MASTYSTNLRLELIGTGEQQGTWGATTNTNLGTLLEQAIGGYETVTVTDGADTTLTTANGATDQARNMTLALTGTLSAARNVICPAIEKVYIVRNATSGGFAVTFKVSGQTGVSIPNGSTYLIYVDGTDARNVTGSMAGQESSSVSITGGIINVGTATVPRSNLQISGTTDPTAVVVGSISGTTLTVTSVTGGTLAVNSRLFIDGAGLDYNTYIVALGTGTGGIGTYVINNTATLSSTTIYAYPTSATTLTFLDTDTATGANQSIGGIEWYNSDASTPGEGIKGYLAVVNESTAPDTAMIFGTSDNASNTQAVERMRITSAGNVGIGTRAPAEALNIVRPASTASYLRYDSGTDVGLNGLAADGSFVSGTFSSKPYTIYTNSGERLRVADDGTVGIDTTTPKAKMHVNGSSTSAFTGTSFSAALLTDTGATLDQFTSLDFGLGANPSAPYSRIGSKYTTSGTFMLFGTSNNYSNGVTNTAMVIDPAGNTAVGINAPLQRFTAANTGITGGAPASSGSAADPNCTMRVTMASVSSDTGAYSSGQVWMQARSTSNYALTYDYILNPNGGSVGIGTTVPSGRLGVYQPTTGNGIYTSTGGGTGNPLYAYVGYASSTSVAAARLVKYDNNTTTSQVFVQFAVNQDNGNNGQINANGASAVAFGTYSDIRLKENIEDLPPQLQNIMALRPVEFDYKDGSGHQIGFIAQEMQTVYPDAVSEGNDGMLTVTAWSKTEARLVKALQDAVKKIDALESRIAALEAQ